MATKRVGVKLDPKPEEGIFLRGKTYWIRYREADGRDRKESARTTNVQRARELRDLRRLEVTQAKHDKKVGVRKRLPTVGELIHTYLPEFEEQVTYRDAVRNAKQWTDTLGKQGMEEVTGRDLKRHISKLTQERNWKPSSVNRHLAFLKTVYKKAARDNISQYNPVTKLPRLEESPRDRYLLPAETIRLQAAMSEYHWLIVSFAIWCGLRKGRMLGIRLRDVDLGDASVQVEERAGRKKTPRQVPLVGSGLEVARQLVAHAQAVGSEWLFPGKNPANHLSEKACHQLLQRALKKADIRDFTWHDLRHTCGSWLAQSGAPLHEIQEALGHRTVTMARRYTHLAQEHRRASMAKLERFFPTVSNGAGAG